MSPIGANHGRADGIAIRLLDANEAETYRRFRIAAISAEPDAFTTTADEAAGLPLDWYRTRIAEGVVGALNGPTLIGTARLDTSGDASIAWIRGLAVEPRWRGAGIGRRLVTEALAEARSRPGIDQVRLSFTAGNGAAERLYATLGFERLGSELRTTSSGESRNKVLMTLRLDRSSACPPQSRL